MLEVDLNIKPSKINAFGFIYKITNLINQKIYIGQTILSVNYRFKLHSKMHEKNKSMPICKAIQKYGHSNFKIEILSVCSSEESLNKMEIKAIAKLKSLSPLGYNISSGGHKTSRETAKRISSKLKGVPKTKEHNLKVSLANKGRKKPPGFAEKLRKHRQENFGIKVKVIKIETGEIFYFNSIHEAAEQTGTHRPNITNCLKGIYKQSKGYMFERLN